MAGLTGPLYVPRPTPIVPRYGLFSAAVGPLDLPLHARIGGLQYELGTCTLPLGYEIRCQQDHATKNFDGSILTKVGFPFVVYAGIECSPVGLTNFHQERIRQYLFEQLTAGEQATVENIFSTSAFGQAEGLGGNPAAVNLGNAVGPVQAVSKLEDWLYARYGLPGVIHAPMKAAAYIKGAHLIEREGGPSSPWRTEVATVVSFGNYAGTGPTGQVPTADDTWIYITGQVAVWRTPDSELLDVPIGQILNRSTNVVDIVLEREYVVTYDCFVAGIQVHLASTDV